MFKKILKQLGLVTVKRGCIPCTDDRLIKISEDKRISSFNIHLHVNEFNTQSFSCVVLHVARSIINEDTDFVYEGKSSLNEMYPSDKPYEDYGDDIDISALYDKYAEPLQVFLAYGRLLMIMSVEHGSDDKTVYFHEDDKMFKSGYHKYSTVLRYISQAVRHEVNHKIRDSHHNYGGESKLESENKNNKLELIRKQSEIDYKSESLCPERPHISPSRSIGRSVPIRERSKRGALKYLPNIITDRAADIISRATLLDEDGEIKNKGNNVSRNTHVSDVDGYQDCDRNSFLNSCQNSSSGSSYSSSSSHHSSDSSSSSCSSDSSSGGSD